MSFVACPTDVVNATPERVWSLITRPAHYESWADARPIHAAKDEVVAGDRLLLTTGPGHVFKVVFEFLALTPPYEVAIDVSLPFGIVNHEVIRIGRLDDLRCRVTFS